MTTTTTTTPAPPVWMNLDAMVSPETRAEAAAMTDELRELVPELERILRAMNRIEGQMGDQINSDGTFDCGERLYTRLLELVGIDEMQDLRQYIVELAESDSKSAPPLPLA